MLVGFDKDELIDYVPEYAGNRDDDNPCIVRLKFVSYSKVQRYARLIAAQTKGTTNPEKITEKAQGVQRKQFTDSVESISGYSIGDKEVTDPGDFYDTADTDLILEIVKAMESQSRLSEGQKKNLSSASDSSLSARTEAPSSVKTVPTEIKKTGTVPTNLDSLITQEG